MFRNYVTGSTLIYTFGGGGDAHVNYVPNLPRSHSGTLVETSQNRAMTGYNENGHLQLKQKYFSAFQNNLFQNSPHLVIFEILIPKNLFYFDI